MKKKYLFVFYIAIFIFSVIFSFDFNKSLIMNQKQNSFLKKEDFNYICLYEGEGHFKNDFYYVKKTHSFYKKGNKLNSDKLMVKDNNINSYDLKEKEIIISENLANLYNIKIGDALEGIASMKDEEELYKVKGILKDVYSVTDNILLEDKGVIICAYDSDINNVKVSSIAFIDKETISGQSITLKEMYDKKEFIKDNRSVIIENILIIFLIFLISSLVIVFINEIVNKGIVRRRIIRGQTILNIFKNSYLASLIINLSLIILSIGAFLVINLVIFDSVIFNTQYFILLIIPFLLGLFNFINIELKVRRY